MIRMWNHFLIPKSALLKGSHRYQFSHVSKPDVGELIPIATLNNNGLWDKKMTPRLVNYKSRFMVVKDVCVVNFLISTRHAYATDNILAVVQVIYGMADDIFSVRYHYLLPKKHEVVFINLKYKKTEDKCLNLYIDSNDPVISILSVSDISYVELMDEPISEFPQDAIDAVEV